MTLTKSGKKRVCAVCKRGIPGRWCYCVAGKYLCRICQLYYEIYGSGALNKKTYWLDDAEVAKLIQRDYESRQEGLSDRK